MMNNLTISFNPQSFRFSSAFLSLQLNLIPGKVLYSFNNIHTARVIYWTTHFFALGRKSLFGVDYVILPRSIYMD